MFFSLFFFWAFLKLSYSAIATFSIANSGIEGWVSVNDRNIGIYLNLTSVNYSLLPSTTCFQDGLHFHIHEKWNASNDDDRIGASSCGDIVTGGHWDPYLACGPKSSNMYCKTYTTGCVTSSSTFDSNDYYACNTTTYGIDPYVCEVADWSGKYGTLQVVLNTSSANMSSFWEVKSSDLSGKAIVFHCANTDKRAFCAPFQMTTNNDASNAMNQTDTLSEDYLAAVFLNQDVVAGYFSFWADGSYEGGFNTYNLDQTCSAGYVYRIYDSWNSNKLSYVGNSTCKTVAGSVWDPTVTCLHGSDSEFCAYSNYALCNSASYSYSCNSTYRYSCSPSDLSGKYGAVGSNYNVFSISGRDDLFPPFSYINGKSLVLECADYSQIVACAKITVYPYLSINITQSVFNAETTTASTTASTTQSKTSSASFCQLSSTIFGAVLLLSLMWM